MVIHEYHNAIFYLQSQVGSLPLQLATVPLLVHVLVDPPSLRYPVEQVWVHCEPMFLELVHDTLPFDSEESNDEHRTTKY